MPDTAPVPNIVPIPGMVQGEVVAGGGGGSGDGSGDGGDGGDGEGAGGGGGGGNAGGDNREGPDPIDPITGRVYTLPVTDLALPGPLPLSFSRSYSSTAVHEDRGFGPGWSHTLGWRVEVLRDRVRVWNDQGLWSSFSTPPEGGEALGARGWLLRRAAPGFVVDAGDDVLRVFSTTHDDGHSFVLTEVEDRNGNRIQLTYEGGRLCQIVDSASRVVKVTSTREGRIASLQVKNADHLGRWVVFARYSYDEKGRLVGAMDADDFHASYEYDEFDRLIRQTDPSGFAVTFVYDARDRGIETWGEYAGKRDPSLAEDVAELLADGTSRARGVGHRKIDYQPRFTQVTDTTETRRYHGNRHGKADKAVAGAGVTTTAYDDEGFVIARTDAVGATTRWSRDARGRVTATTDPLGNEWRFERDRNGLPVRTVDPTGAVTTALRDSSGNVVELRDAVGVTTRCERDDRGLVTAMTEATGATTLYEYDAAGNLVTIVQPNGGRWSITHDGLGRRQSIRDPTGAETRYAYSDRGDLQATFDPTGAVTRYSYDGVRRVTQVVGRKGEVTSYVWGGMNALCARRDANGNLLRLAYDREGALVAVHNERGEVHRLEYDTSGVLLGERTFDGRELRYKNDANGRVVRFENGAGEPTVIQYDLTGRVVARELADGEAETFEYDARGDLVAATNAAARVTLVRDALGRVVRERIEAGGQDLWIEVEYDAAGSRVSRTLSTGHVERFERDVMGARTRTWLGGTQVQHENDVLGREVRRLLPGGGAIENEFDALGRVARRSARGRRSGPAVGPGQPEWIGPRDDGLTSEAVYGYDPNDELVAVGDRSAGQTTYQYDPVGQILAAVPERARAEVFRWDPAGNPSEAGPDGPGRVYGAGNRLLEHGSTHYTWDDDGRLSRKVEGTTSPRTWSYEWNGAGMLRQVNAPDGKRIHFQYDALGRRTSKTAEERDGLAWREVSRTSFLWDGDTLAHEIREKAAAAGRPVVEERTYWFEDGGFQPVAHRVKRRDDPSGADGWVHYLNDPSGAPDRLIAEDGEVACRFERTAWGDLRQDAGARADTPLRLQGQYWDEETGCSYNRLRYYDPAEGRFLSPDPLGLLVSTNDYAFAPNAIVWTDPHGLSPSLSQIRQGYNDEVTQIKDRAHARIACGESPEDAAKWAVEERKKIGQKYKAMTPWYLRPLIYARNIAPTWLGGKGYASIYGPSYEQQMAKYNNDPMAVINAASTPNQKLNQQLGVK
jgi:RHS repeat-associated protein